MKEAEKRQESTGMETVLGGSRLGKNFKIKKAHRHESQGESRHQTSKQYQHRDRYYLNEKLWFAAFVVLFYTVVTSSHHRLIFFLFLFFSC